VYDIEKFENKSIAYTESSFYKENINVYLLKSLSKWLPGCNLIFKGRFEADWQGLDPKLIQIGNGISSFSDETELTFWLIRFIYHNMGNNQDF